MAQLIPNSFSSYSLTPVEEASGTILNLQQKMVLQNKLSDVATQKLNLIFDPSNPADFQIQNSYLQGQLDIMNWQLESSASVEAELAASNLPPETKS